MSWKIAFYISAFIIIVCCIVSGSIASYQMKKEGKRKAKVATVKKKSKFERLFFDLPYQVVKDSYNRTDYEFTESGLHLVVGGQGSGKTVTMVYLLMKYKDMFPDVKIRTNFNYVYEDGTIEDWRDIVFSNNGVKGEIDAIDELQNWFNSMESKDFPPEMLQEICQERKQRKILLGSSQIWGRVGKPIREQVKYVYKPFTIFGALTIVRKFLPEVNTDGEIEKLKYRDCFFFVHDDKIRNAYDTYKKIQAISLKGFKPRSEQLSAERYKSVVTPQRELRSS